MDLQYEIDNTTSGVIQLPYGETTKVDHLTINREVLIQGVSMTSSRLEVNTMSIPCRSTMGMKNLRITGPGSGVGITFDYAFSSYLERVLMEHFTIDVEIKAGNAWDITRCRLLAKRACVLINNFENGDEGDWSIFGTTMAEEGSGGDAAVFVESSGGGRMVDNKILGFTFPVLLQTKCNSSDFIGVANSIENYRLMGLAGRVVSGSYENIVWVGNQHMSSSGHGVSMDHMNRVAVFGNVGNCVTPFYQKDGVANSAEGANVT